MAGPQGWFHSSTTQARGGRLGRLITNGVRHECLGLSVAVPPQKDGVMTSRPSVSIRIWPGFHTEFGGITTNTSMESVRI